MVGCDDCGFETCLFSVLRFGSQDESGMFSAIKRVFTKRWQT